MSRTDRRGRRRPLQSPAAHQVGESRRSHRWLATSGELAGAVVAALGVSRAPLPVVTPPLERICADLHRINREITRVLADPRIPARYHRLLAATWAYDAALVDACRAVGVEPPEPPPLDHFGRLETEAALTAHGVHW